MKIAVVAANGRNGQGIVREALKRGAEVTAIIREGENKTEATNVLHKDLFDLTAEDLKGFDVVVDAFGVWNTEDMPLHITSLKHLADILSGTDTRLIVVGGAGSLYLDDSHTTRVMDTPDFPRAFIPVATNMGEALDHLRTRTDVKWTYISPAADFQADGAYTGSYILAGEVFTVNDRGVSEISYADFDLALVDEAFDGNHIQQRISVLSK